MFGFCDLGAQTFFVLIGPFMLRSTIMSKPRKILSGNIVLLVVTTCFICITAISIAHADNHAPVANPGGPYFTTVGHGIALDGSGSVDFDAPLDHITNYKWSFGGYSDQDTSNSVLDLSYSELDTLFNGSLHVGGAYEISLVVTDTHGATSTPVETLLRVGAAETVPEPATMLLLGLGLAGLAGLRRKMK